MIRSPGNSADQPVVTEAFSPQHRGVAIHRQRIGNGDIGLARSGGQNNTAAQSDLRGSAVRRNPLLQFLLFYPGSLTRLPHIPG
jgi:hypothetical protein